ncbi:MAG: type II secretion system protein GspE [Solibacterales bacterium]|nr:type II secretion system protein GspE [Bryobacterales bacterium]|tara:strand:+ start:35473 stop:37119 length:1647 start_codon:yes stop_codon:yes gene_type:complete
MSVHIGEILIEKGVLARDDLDRAVELQKERGDKLGKILMDLGFVAPREVLLALSEQLETPLVTVQDFPSVLPDIDAITVRYMRQFRFLPLELNGDVLTLAMVDPLDFETLASVRSVTGFEVRAVLSSEQEILDAIDKHYGEEEAEQESHEYGVGGNDSAEIEHLRDMASEAPVIRFVNMMISVAIEKRASDIHLEPFEKDFRVRFRVDGVLEELESPPRELQAAIVSRVKLMAKLNIAERRLPQDGRIKIKVVGHEVDLRVSTLPTLYGESVVMRLLDRSATDFYELTRLGFDDRMLERMEFYTSLPHGVFLVTGPTGSGKSTTLYSALKRINVTERKIITIEDPVEYQMDGINQIHVNSQIGLTFAAGLRHIVRQDPDVIMVGEIRDRETADIAIRSALTGHFVYSTLHTNDAPSAITRLTDMGIENYLITSSVVGVLAQRLVRVICSNCSHEDQVVESPEGGKVQSYRGEGCEKCAKTGYLGRMGIFEMMELNEEIRELIMTNADASKLTDAARRNGMRNLREDGWEKIVNGTTTVDEVMRVTQEF